jgi:hypothetical protein
MVSGDESRDLVRREEPFPERFSVTKDSEFAFRNRITRTVGRGNATDVKYVTGHIGETHSFLGSIPHVHMLQLQVLAATLLTEMGAKFVEGFTMIDGPVRVLETAMHYCKSDANDHISLVGVLLIFMNRLIASSPVVRSDMEAKSALDFFLFLSERSVDEHTKAQAVRAIALLCASADCQTQLREQEGIQFLVLAVRRCVELKKPLVGLRAGIKVGDKYSMDQVSLIYPVK